MFKLCWWQFLDWVYHIEGKVDAEIPHRSYKEVLVSSTNYIIRFQISRIVWNRPTSIPVTILPTKLRRINKKQLPHLANIRCRHYYTPTQRQHHPGNRRQWRRIKLATYKAIKLSLTIININIDKKRLVGNIRV